MAKPDSHVTRDAPIRSASIVLYDNETDRALIEIPLTSQEIAIILSACAVAELPAGDIEIDATPILEAR